VVVHRRGVERAQGAVVEQDVEERQQVGEPLLVGREQRDHHEEVEVRLDPAVPEVDEDRGARQQPDRDHRRAAAPPEPADAGRDRERGDRDDLERGVPDRGAGGDAEREQRGHMEPQQDGHRPVAARPERARERVPPRQAVAPARQRAG
jgi:hypothetical protein